MGVHNGHTQTTYKKHSTFSWRKALPSARPSFTTATRPKTATLNGIHTVHLLRVPSPRIYAMPIPTSCSAFNSIRIARRLARARHWTWGRIFSTQNSHPYYILLYTYLSHPAYIAYNWLSDLLSMMNMQDTEDADCCCLAGEM